MNAARPAAWALLAVVLLAPWAFGTGDVSWAVATAGASLVPVACALLIAAARAPVCPATRTEVAAAALVLAVPALGLLPAPEWVRDVLVPGGSALLRAVAPDAAAEVRPISLAPRETRIALALAAAYVGAFFVLRAEARRSGGRTAISAGLLVTGSALAVLGIVQHVTQRDVQSPQIYWSVPIPDAGTPFGPYVNRNHFAGAMALLAALAAGEALARAGEGRRGAALVFWGGTATMVAALVATMSRGGLVAAAAAAAVLLAALPRARRLRGALALVAGAGVVAIVLAASGRLDPLVERVSTLSGRWTGRFAVQRDAVVAFAGNPWVGTGAGSFEQVFPPFQRVCDDRSFSNAHSDWAQLLMETGLLGCAATVVVLLLIRTWWRAGTLLGGPARWRVAGGLAGAAAIGAHGFFDVNLRLPANALLTVCALSLASAAAAAAHRADGAARPASAPTGAGD